MKIINLSDQNSIINRYLAEMRDKEYQKNRLLFRNNIKRIGESEAFFEKLRQKYMPGMPKKDLFI